MSINKYAAFAIFVVLFTAFYNLLIFLFGLLITHSPYRFDVWNSVILPMALGVGIGYFVFLREKKPKQ